MRRVLVTGGAGFIGSHLVDRLLDEGDDVAILDDLSTGREDNLAEARARGARLHVGDVTDAGAVAEVLAAHRPEVIFHLAAQIDVRRSVEDPAFDARVNVEGTAVVLDAARRSGVRRFVCASTGGALYGEADVVPTPEAAPVRPLSPYGQHKYAAEGLCHLFERLHGLDTICLRYANVYGPRQHAAGEGGVIAAFCARAATGERPSVFGTGLQTRDFVYVGDVVAANLLAADSTAGGSFNVGTGRETSVLQILEAIDRLRAGEQLGPLPPPRFLDARLGEVVRSCLAPAAARAALGWHAAVALDEGLALTLERSLDLLSPPGGVRS